MLECADTDFKMKSGMAAISDLKNKSKEEGHFELGETL
jgi:hypothetical protein